MIYTIPEKKEPISNCVLKLELNFNLDSNSDNNDNKNNSSSSVQYGNQNSDNSNSDSNSEQYIVLPDLIKKQELKWFSDNNEGIMSECVHNTDTEFDLRYPKKEVIKLEPNLCTCIDLKIALEIPATTMVQLASRSSLAKREINIRGGIINTRYVRNIIAMLQNNLEKIYIIEPNEKILVLVENREELGITAREIQGFRSMSRIDVPVNMAEEKIADKRKIILIRQSIFILPYDQYMYTIDRKVKDQVQIFEAELAICESKKIGHISLHIPAKNHNYIKIFIYNNTENILCEYVNITSQTIYGQKECYLLQPKQLEQINIRNLDPLQCMQLKILLNNFNDIFASENEFGRTDIIQHQIKMRDVISIKQRAYKIPLASHKIIRQEINQMLDNRLIESSMSP
ncbi:hypothetical protein G9A89_007804 [Geosiphon pyriformis]|nr:hypothetical protein G9A89_007804 [Geosiphon pyriformis]